jgi:hypothetical protein
MTFTVTINCDNAAFNGDVSDSPDVVTAGREVSRILQEVIDKVRHGNDSGNCRDINGNHVGEFSFAD